MRVVAIDSAGAGCSAALLDAAGDDSTVEQCEAHPERAGAEHLLALMSEVLGGPLDAEAAKGVNALAFGRGPGGFTSVRCTVSLAHGLALAGGLPLLPVSNLAALAQRATAVAALESALVLAVTDARLGEIYCGLYHLPGGRQAPAPLAPDALCTPAGENGVAEWAAEQVAAWAPDALPPLLIAGNALDVHADALDLSPLAAIAPTDELRRLPSLAADAAAIATVAAARLAAGEVGVEPEQAPPVYLRERVADVPRRMRVL